MEKATRKFSVKANKLGTAHEIEATFHFTGWTTEDFQEKVLQSVTIDIQRRLREEGDTYIRALKGQMEVTVPRPGTKVATDPVNAAIKAKGGDIDALVAELLAEKARRANQR